MTIAVEEVEPKQGDARVAKPGVGADAVADVGADANGAPCARRATDRRSARTEASLKDALIALLSERPLDAITVGDLCGAADVTRGTFYNHYKDKDALVGALEDEVLSDLGGLQERLGRMELAEVAFVAGSGQPLPVLVEVFDYLRGQGAFLRVVMGPHGDSGFSSRLRESVCTTVVRSMLHRKYRDNPTEFVEYYVAFFASAYLGVIERWIETGMRQSNERMALIAQRLLFISPGEPIEL